MSAEVSPSAAWKKNHPKRYAAGNRRRRALRIAADPDRVRALERAAVARWREKHPDGRWHQSLKTHGLTPEQYWALFKEQGGVCSICHEPERQYAHLAVDHDHVTGRVRGLLCFGCNKLLGYAHDQPSLLISAAAYLDRKPKLELVAQEV